MLLNMELGKRWYSHLSRTGVTRFQAHWETLGSSSGPAAIKLQVCVSHSLQPHGLKPTRLLCPWNSPGKNTGVGSHFLLQGIFPTQGLKPHLFCLLHCRQILDRLSHQESPRAIPTLPGLRFFICSSTYLACLIGLMWQWNKQRTWKTIEAVKQQRVNWQEGGCTDSCSYRGSFVWF